MSFLPMILMFLSSTGGLNELLDLTEPQSFLQAQGVEYRVEALLEVLAEPVTKDIDQAKAQEVKKLQAMRALGALKDKAALPALKGAAGSKLLFFNEYATEAIAAIEGKPHVVATVSAERLKKDLALLPAGVGTVVQAHLSGAGGVDLKEVVVEVLKGMSDAPEPEVVFEQVNQQIGGIANKVGNLRIDAITLGLSSDVGNDAGFVVILCRGLYDHRAVESFFSEQKRTTHHDIAGTMFLGMDGDDAAVAAVSRELLVFVSGPGWEKFPLEEVAAKLKAQPAQPEFEGRLKRVIARADQSSPLWGAGILSEGMKEAPPLAPFDELLLGTSGLKEKEKSLLKLEGLGKDANAIAESVGQMKEMVAQGIAELEDRGAAEMEPILKVMKSIEFSSEGLNGSMTAEFDGNPASMVGGILTMFSDRRVRGVREGGVPAPNP